MGMKPKGYQPALGYDLYSRSTIRCLNGFYGKIRSSDDWSLRRAYVPATGYWMWGAAPRRSRFW